MQVTQAQSPENLLSPGLLTALLFLHPPFPSKQDKEHTFLRQCCSQGTIVIHHFPPEKCKYVLADSGVIYYPGLRYWFEQDRLPAKHYLLVPLGGSSGWAELGLEAMPGAKAGTLASEKALGLCHQGSTSLGAAEVAATLEVGSWRLSMLRRLEPGSMGCPDSGHWGWGGNWPASLVLTEEAHGGGLWLVVSLDPGDHHLPGWMFVSLDQLCSFPECTPVLPIELTLWNPRGPRTAPLPPVCHLQYQEADSFPGGAGKGSKSSTLSPLLHLPGPWQPEPCHLCAEGTGGQGVLNFSLALML